MADTSVAVTPGTGVSIHVSPRTLADGTTTNAQGTFDAGLVGVLRVTSVSVTTSATALPSSALSDRKALYVENHGAVTVYIGGSGVTAANGGGLKLSPGKGLALPFAAGATVYGIVASGTCTVAVAEAS